MYRNKIKPVKITRYEKKMRKVHYELKHELDLWAMQREERQRSYEN